MPTRTEQWGIHPGESASTLEVLANSVYREIVRRPTALADLKNAMVALLGYLASPSGRTDDNCRVVDTFFCIRDHWETDWEHLPTEFRRVLEDLGGALHDTVSFPNIARSLDSTPEQLFARAREL